MISDVKIKNGYLSKDSVPLKTIPTLDALAMACAMQRINKGYVKDTRRFSEDNPTIFSNKEALKFAFWQQNPDYLPTDFVRPTVVQEDYEEVTQIQKWLKRYVMLGLGNLDDFKRDMIESVSQDTVTLNNLGRVAFIPEFVKRDKHETSLTKEIRMEYRDSQYLGKEKESVDTVIAILDSRYSSQWESYNYTGADTKGNLVSFMNKFQYDVGTMLRIKGKVKAQTKNKLFDVNETRLNYVKIYKV
jgi:hypothetical protein